MKPAPAFPVARWLAILWLAIWFPVYWHVWGPANFLFLCDVAVVLTCIGLWAGSPLLLSSQAIASIALNLLWSANIVLKLATGKLFISGSEYMWDEQFPLLVRLMSLFHVVWPPLLVWAVRRVGYDRRGLWLQSAIAALTLVASRVVGAALTPPKNINFALADPIFDQQIGSVPMHLAITLAALVAVIYVPTHWALQRWMPPAPNDR